jgi:hypothetical protein
MYRRNVTWVKLLQFVIHRGVTYFAPLHGPAGFKICRAFHIRLLLDISTLLEHCSFYRIVANTMILLPGIVLCCWNTSACNIANMVCCQIQRWFMISCFLSILLIKGLINIAQMQYFVFCYIPFIFVTTAQSRIHIHINNLWWWH